MLVLGILALGISGLSILGYGVSGWNPLSDMVDELLKNLKMTKMKKKSFDHLF